MSAISCLTRATGALSCLLFATEGRAGTFECDNDLLTVAAKTPVLAARVCRVADDALTELAACNVTLDLATSISIRDDMQDDCIGVYHCGEQRIDVLSPAGIAERRTEDSAFAGIPTDRYFESVIVHELAHAAADALPCPFGHCVATTEYVAYAMQVRSLSPEDRETFEAEFDMSKKIPRDRLNAMILYMAPDRFAQFSWAHFQQRPDSCAYIGQIMRGDIVLDIEHP